MGNDHHMSNLIGFEPFKKGEGSFGHFKRARKANENKDVIANKVYARLREAILNAELRPNKRLVEDDLADWLNVSRTPIREALLLLEKDGLVGRHHGWLVHEQSSEEIRNRLECRLATEGYAAYLASKLRSDADLQELKALAVMMEKPGISGLEFYRTNDRFHQVIVEAARNPILTNLHSQTKMYYWGFDAQIIAGPEADQRLHEQHRALIGALLAQDGVKAEAIARDHVQLKIQIILKFLQIKEEDRS